MTEYPIIGIVGDRGGGKTLTAVNIVDEYQKAGLKVFSNFELIGIPYEHIEFNDIVDFPEYLHDGVIIIDEAHIGTDAYDFFSKRVREITKFATQIRKRRLIFLYTTQVFTQVAKRLRQQTDYIMYCNELHVKGLIRVELYSNRTQEYINGKTVDLSAYFGKYDTNELIMLK